MKLISIIYKFYIFIPFMNFICLPETGYPIAHDDLELNYVAEANLKMIN